MFKPIEQNSLVRGLLLKKIPYEDRLKDEKWSDYFGKYEPQKYGRFDSNSCWALSGINCIEDQLEFLWKKNLFSDEAKHFFTSNGYIDQDGDFSLSERFIEILSNVTDTGNSTENFWELVEEYGCIPRAHLTYTVEQANQWLTQADFDRDYFDKTKVTAAMFSLGQQFLKYVDIAHQRIGRLWFTPSLTQLRTALLQAPVQISIPVKASGWAYNQSKVKYAGGTNLDHAVELYAVNDPTDPKYDPKEADYPYYCFDQYIPNLKQFSSDYFIGGVVQGVVTVKNQPIITPLPKQTFWQRMWLSLSDYFN